MISLGWAIWVLLAVSVRGFDDNNNKYKVRVGALLTPGDESLETVLRFSLSQLNNSFLHLIPNHLEVELVEQRLESVDAFQISKGICNLLDKGIVALVASASSASYNAIASYSNNFQIPWVIPFSSYVSKEPHKFGVNVQPDLQTPFNEVLKFFHPSSISYIYDFDKGSDNLFNILTASGIKAKILGQFQTAYSSRSLAVLKQQAQTHNGTIDVILDVKPNLASEILAELSIQPYALQSRFRIFLASPVSNEFWKPEFLRLNVTAMKWLDMQATTIRDFEFKWNHLQSSRYQSLSLKTLLSYDAVKVLVESLSRLVKSEDVNKFHSIYYPGGKLLTGTGGIDCLQAPINFWKNGPLVAQYLKETVLTKGLTGVVQLSKKGDRAKYEMDVITTTHLEQVTIGSWSSHSGLVMRVPSPGIQMEEATSGESMRDKVFQVTTVLAEPYVYRVGDKFEGFCIDLLEHLGKRLGFKYTINLVGDGKYGIFLPAENRWNGMVGELVDKKADMAFAPLTITSARELAMDFTIPYEHTGIGLLLKKPESKATFLPAFFFLDVFTVTVWVCLIVSYIIMSGLIYGAVFYTSGPDRTDNDEATDSKLSLCGSFWFVMGSCLFQGTGIYPRSTSSRLAISLWWFFSLLFGAMYIAGLASYLIDHRSDNPSSQYNRLRTMTATEVMEEFLKTGSPQIGVLRGGSTAAFFLNSNIPFYKQYGEYLAEHPELYGTTTSEAVERVRNEMGNFAMLLETSSMEHNNAQKPCDTMSAQGYFDNNRGYGIGLQHNSPYKNTLDIELLTAKETGVIHKISAKWFQHRSECRAENANKRSIVDLYNGRLNLSEIAGLFYLLLAGVILVAVITAVEKILLKKKEDTVELYSMNRREI